MLRYQQQFSFFDESKLGKAVRFINLSDLALEQDLNAVLEEIVKQVTAVDAGVVVVDSFRTLARKAGGAVDTVEVQSFIHRLSQFLTGWEATTFLIGEYAEDEIRDNSLFTLVDGIFWLSQVSERNSVVRKLQIMKLRGQATVPGLHTVRITHDGVQAFSRTLGLIGSKTVLSPRRRLSVGIPELDRMLGGGISKATASWWPDPRAPANRHWRRNSSPRDCAMGNPASWRSSRSARKATRSGRTPSAST